MKKIVSLLSIASLALSVAACTPATNRTKTSNYGAPSTFPYTTGTTNITGTPGTTGPKLYVPGNIGYTHDSAPGTNTPISGGTTTYGTVPPLHGPGMHDIRDQMLQKRGFTNTGITSNGYRTYSTVPPATSGTTVPGTDHPSLYKAPGSNIQINQTKSGVGFAQTPVGTAKSHITPHVYVDRQMLASAVANVTKQIPGVKQATVLTTDNQIFVGIDTSGLTKTQARSILKKVQMAAENVSPRYYKVYSSNDQDVINKVRHHANTFANKTDPQFEEMIGHKTHLSTTPSTNKSSGSHIGK